MTISDANKIAQFRRFSGSLSSFVESEMPASIHWLLKSMIKKRAGPPSLRLAVQVNKVKNCMAADKMSRLCESIEWLSGMMKLREQRLTMLHRC